MIVKLRSRKNNPGAEYVMSRTDAESKSRLLLRNLYQEQSGRQIIRREDAVERKGEKMGSLII